MNKLAITRETIRNLDNPDLSKIIGGGGSTGGGTLETSVTCCPHLPNNVTD